MGNDIEIRKYAPADKAAALNLIRLNTPRFFAPAETEEFGRYLDMYPETYYMLLLDGKIAGGGGVFFAKDGNAASLAWGMIHPAHRRKGLGTALTRFRMEKIRAAGVGKITVRTSQRVWKFYEKQGFSLTETKKDFWGEGLDLYAMEFRGNG